MGSAGPSGSTGASGSTGSKLDAKFWVSLVACAISIASLAFGYYQWDSANKKAVVAWNSTTTLVEDVTNKAKESVDGIKDSVSVMSNSTVKVIDAAANGITKTSSVIEESLGKANEIADESLNTIKNANELSSKANDLTETANGIAESAAESARESNAIISENWDKSNELIADITNKYTDIINALNNQVAELQKQTDAVLLRDAKQQYNVIAENRPQITVHRDDANLTDPYNMCIPQSSRIYAGDTAISILASGFGGQLPETGGKIQPMPNDIATKIMAIHSAHSNENKQLIVAEKLGSDDQSYFLLWDYVEDKSTPIENMVLMYDFLNFTLDVSPTSASFVNSILTLADLKLLTDSEPPEKNLSFSISKDGLDFPINITEKETKTQQITIKMAFLWPTDKEFFIDAMKNIALPRTNGNSVLFEWITSTINGNINVRNGIGSAFSTAMLPLSRFGLVFKCLANNGHTYMYTALFDAKKDADGVSTLSVADVAFVDVVDATYDGKDPEPAFSEPWLKFLKDYEAAPIQEADYTPHSLE